MKIRKDILIAVIIAVVVGACSGKQKPPKAAIKSVTDNYFGVSVSDPYRYMENMDDTIFLNWMKEYAGYSRSILDEIPGRKELVDKMVEFDSRKSDMVKGLMITESNRYFYMKITPEDEIAKLYFRDGYEGSETLLFDPETYSGDEEMQYAISWYVPTDNGKLVVIAVAPNGSESASMKIMDVTSGEFLSDHLVQSAGRVEWLCDGDGFVYTKTNSDDIHDPGRYLDMKVYFHQLGTPQKQDKLVFSSEKYPELGKKPEEFPYVMYDNDQNMIYLALYTVERFLKVFYAPCAKKDLGNIRWKPLIGQEDKVLDFYPMEDSIYLYTAKDASRFKLLKTSLLEADIEKARVVVPEHKKGILSGFAFSNEALYYKLTYNGIQEKLFRIGHGERITEAIKLPIEAGSAWIATRGHKYGDVWITLSGWTLDKKRFRFSPSTGSFQEEQLSSEAEFPEFDDLIVEEVMVPSHDGVEVPLSLMYMAGTKLDGTAPLLITGYGAYGKSRTPYFSPFSLLWTTKGGIMAVAHVRGGGELGDAWHRAGFKDTKPNTWKDLIACTEYLIEKEYTSSGHTALYGASAGGILVGRAMIDRPDLFAAVIPAVGAMNPLRAEQSPNGPVNSTEFGTVKDSAECMALIEMDSYLNLVDGVDYPATLVTAGFNDPRVIIWAPAKFSARLQAANASRNPILFNVDYSSGHGVGDSKTKSLEGLSDIFAFALWQTGHSDFQK